MPYALHGGVGGFILASVRFFASLFLNVSERDIQFGGFGGTFLRFFQGKLLYVFEAGRSDMSVAGEMTRWNSGHGIPPILH